MTTTQITITDNVGGATMTVPANQITETLGNWLAHMLRATNTYPATLNADLDEMWLLVEALHLACEPNSPTACERDDIVAELADAMNITINCN